MRPQKGGVLLGERQDLSYQLRIQGEVTFPLISRSYPSTPIPLSFLFSILPVLGSISRDAHSFSGFALVAIASGGGGDQKTCCIS